MKRFRYSLETLLSLRREKEQEREIDLARAAGELAMIDQKINAARKFGEDAFSRQALDLEDMVARDRMWAKSVNDQQSLELPRREAVRKVDNARGLYVEAHRERNALDRLKERRFEQWRKDTKKEEIKRLDETAKSAERRRLLVGGDE